MAVKYIKFFFVKLFLILFASVAATLTAFLFSLTLPETADATFRAILTGAVPSAVFFAFIYSFESKIKIPEGTVLTTAYFAAFTVKETSVYAVFALIPNIAAAAAELPSDGLFRNLLLPHTSSVMFGLPVAVNYVIFVLLYAAVSFGAHLLRSKKPQSAAPDVTAAQPDVPSEDSAEPEDTDDEN